MPWKRTQSNVSRISRRSPLKSSTLAFLFASFSLVAFAPLSSSASDEDYIAAVADDLGLDRGGLFLMVSGLQAAGGSSGNITNDVAAILAILTSVDGTTGGVHGLATRPFGFNGQLLSKYLFSALYDGASGDGNVARSNSYLKKIWDKLSSSPLGATNDLSFIETNLGYINDSWYHLFTHVWPLTDGLLWDIFMATSNATNWVDEFRYSSGLWNSHVDDSQWQDLLSGLSSISSAIEYQDSPFDDSAWNDFSGDVGDIASDIADILYYVEHIDQDIHDEMIADSDEISQASSETVQIEYEEESGQDAFDDQLADDTSDTEDILADNEPDYEVHYTDNPMEPLTNAVNFRSNMERYLPALDNLNTTDKTRVYLFKTEWDPQGLLTRSGGGGSRSGMQWNGLQAVYFDLSGSDEHVPNQLLNYASTAMAWAWNLSACILAFLMLKQFWDWVASWRA